MRWSKSLEATDQVVKLAPCARQGSVVGGGEKLNKSHKTTSIMEQFSGNYTGPYWSDGKLQTSVEFGESDPKSELDALSRLHDSAYAKFQDRGHREAADMMYEEQAKKLVGRFPSLAGDLVLYGNYATRQAARGIGLAKYGLPGLLYFGVDNAIKANKMINGTYLSKEKKDVADYYLTDPHKIALSEARRQVVTPVIDKVAKKSSVQPGDLVEGKHVKFKFPGIKFPDFKLKTSTNKVHVMPYQPPAVSQPESQADRNHRLKISQALRFERAAQPKKKRKKKLNAALPEKFRQSHIAELEHQLEVARRLQQQSHK